MTILVNGVTPGSVDMDFLVQIPEVERLNFPTLVTVVLYGRVVVQSTDDVQPTRRAQEFATLPVQVIDKGTKSWCVLQSESCSVPWGGGVAGSSDATTCVIVFLLSSIGVTVLHLDEQSSRNSSYLQRCIPREQEHAELFLIGGYEDERGTSGVVVNNVLQQLHACPVKLELRQAFVGAINTVHVPGGNGVKNPVPRHQAACVDLDRKVVRPAYFAYRGPAFSTRQCRLMSAHNSFGEIRDADSGCFRVSRWPFQLRHGQVASFRSALQLDDRSLLNCSSTSPLAEGPRFVEDIKDTFETLVQHPCTTALFPHGDLLFEWDGVEWVEVIKGARRMVLPDSSLEGETHEAEERAERLSSEDTARSEKGQRQDEERRRDREGEGGDGRHNRRMASHAVVD